ncbi:hypothetical protein DVA86_08095 [Streptomyces armeniacus]|uniref:Uncharacterized protein n=1 Tax=Streptomyces armeniacus TaxID=83291 RepID=A0A345XLU5_9ACTN|nr:hypothetical protein DVA86_08095 [Streptomyces armeniacus]
MRPANSARIGQCAPYRPRATIEGPAHPARPATRDGRGDERGPIVLTLLMVFTLVTLLTGWLISIELRRERERAEVKPNGAR